MDVPLTSELLTHNGLVMQYTYEDQGQQEYINLTFNPN